MSIEDNRLFTYFEIMKDHSPSTFNEVLKYSNGLKNIQDIPNKDIIADINQLIGGTYDNGGKEII